ncbi:hypothetical protein NDN08_008059 [Rhodosorus marinus]|uniref:Complex 1 LYR protein domain-containing protein n=1 Tax=Rhodosorus marinus TaxID=101924 RepID=A0AAV8UZD4_9RHOD|nr:hypothetical protein NDN08_008059 [Rhodosorus marinus]
MAVPRPASLSAFRALLRAQHKTFVGDKEMLERARIHSREQFLKNKDLTDDAEIERLRKEADNATDFILNDVVRAELNQKNGRYVIDGAKLTERK